MTADIIHEEFNNPERDCIIYKNIKIGVAEGDLIIEDTDAIVAPTIGLLVYKEHKYNIMVNRIHLAGG